MRVNLSQVQKKYYDRIVARNRVHNGSHAVIVYAGEEAKDEEISIKEEPKKKGAARYTALKQRIGSRFDSIIEVQLCGADKSLKEAFPTDNMDVNQNDVTGLSPVQAIGSEVIQDYMLVQEQGNRNSTVALKFIATALQTVTSQLAASQAQNVSLTNQLYEARAENVRLMQEHQQVDSNSLASTALTQFGGLLMQQQQQQQQTQQQQQQQPQQPKRPQTIAQSPPQRPLQNIAAPVPPTVNNQKGIQLSDIFDLMPQFGIDPEEIPAEKYKNLVLMSQDSETTLGDYIKEFMKDDAEPIEPTE